MSEDEDTSIDLPLVNIEKTDVLGALFVHTDNHQELYHDALLKLQTWIINFAEEQIVPLRDSNCFTEEEIDDIKKKMCVISPITLTLYLHWKQMEDFSRLPDSEKERILLEKLENEENPDSAENRHYKLEMTFNDFLKDLGKRIKEESKQKAS